VKIGIISSTTYRACLPDDPNCLAFYGSEGYHSLLVRELLKKGHELEWYAPAGSSEFREFDNCNFHPIKFTNGIMENRADWIINNTALDGSRTEDLAGCDAVIDMTGTCHDIEILWNYLGYNKFICYRNGYAAYNVPRIPNKYRHYAVPSVQNQKLFKQAGFEADLVYYGISEHYKPGEDEEYWQYFDKKGLTKKEYWLYSHRPTVEKGLNVLLYLAKKFPEDVFVVSCSTPINQHYISLLLFLRTVNQMGLDNIAYIPSPENPRHHYYKRELYRNARAALAPFDPNVYKEGFGLTTAEIIASGTPVLITDSESTRELWVENQDGLFCDSTGMFEMALRHFSSYSFDPKNRYPPAKYAERYEELIQKIPS